MRLDILLEHITDKILSNRCNRTKQLTRNRTKNSSTHLESSKNQPQNVGLAMTSTNSHLSMWKQLTKILSLF
jgi:hypothetical protein